MNFNPEVKVIAVGHPLPYFFIVIKINKKLYI